MIVDYKQEIEEAKYILTVSEGIQLSYELALKKDFFVSKLLKAEKRKVKKIWFKFDSIEWDENSKFNYTKGYDNFPALKIDSELELKGIMGYELEEILGDNEEPIEGMRIKLKVLKHIGFERINARDIDITVLSLN